MHPNEHIGRAIAQECIRQDMFQPDPKAHRRMSTRILDAHFGNGARAELDTFISGAPREGLAAVFWET
eukprot:13895144-Alexandrium_andersonii.AAC.1